MKKNHNLWHAATLVIVSLVIACPANAQQSSEIEAIKAANQAFYDALSGRNAKAMERVWAKKPYVVNIGPRDTKIRVGFEDAVSNYWPRTFDLLSEIDVKMTSIAHTHVERSFASVVGTERAVTQRKAGGKPQKFDLFVTNLFEKDSGHWLMISHHAQKIPK